MRRERARRAGAEPRASEGGPRGDRAGTRSSRHRCGCGTGRPRHRRSGWPRACRTRHSRDDARRDRHARRRERPKPTGKKKAAGEGWLRSGDVRLTSNERRA